MPKSTCHPIEVLVIGSGAREYEMVRKIAESPIVCTVFCAPGNAGMRRIPGAECIDIKANDIPALLEFAKLHEIALTIVGPEEPLVNGIVDVFEDAKLPIFGPSEKAAMLEGSKIFAKHFMDRHDIPTAPFNVFANADEAVKLLKKTAEETSIKFPLVLKMDGLAAGKGVRVCNDLQSALEFLEEIKAGKFGNADGSILLENCLTGEEASYIVSVDKKGNFVPMASSQDHKRIGDGDVGFNTGGMGAYSPAPVITAAVEKEIQDIVRKVIKGMKEEGNPFFGFLYLGLMIKDEEPSVLEFNVRLGDPETQPIMARMKSSLVALIFAAIEGKLDTYTINWDDVPAVCVVAAAEGYPGTPRKGDEIFGIKDAEKTGAIVSFAGVALNESGDMVTAGGRVLSVTAKGDFVGDYLGAKEAAYGAIKRILFPGQQYRTDIADRAICRQ